MYTHLIQFCRETLELFETELIVNVRYFINPSSQIS